MTIISGILLFTLVWWMAFFCVLPFRVEPDLKAQGGNLPGAPKQSHIKGKVIITTAIAIGVWLIIYALVKANIISYHDIAQQMTT